MVLCRELKIFHGKFKSKRKISFIYCQAVDFNSASIDFPQFLPEFGSRMEGDESRNILVILCAQLQDFFNGIFFFLKKGIFKP